PRSISNIPASVRERLRNVSLQSGKEFQSIIRQYVQERFLYRLSKSVYGNSFILKGALLFIAYDISRLRPTKDIDFLGSSISNDEKDIKAIFKEILQVGYEDGLVFDYENIRTEIIAEDGNYHGVRVKIDAFLLNIRERLQIDIGFDDKIVPGPADLIFPALLDFPAPRLKAYSIESALAEKFEAMVSINLFTSRVKDVYDIIYFADFYNFKKDSLKNALMATFSNRGTDIEKRELVFSSEFKEDPQRKDMWKVFLSRSKLNPGYNFSEAVNKIKIFIDPIFTEENASTWNPSKWKWE
ncbi:MAG: nucleotidyl transferase AbiEii/AbiGii toxin family protein, partial [Ignavibacteriales bacterium]